MSRRYISSPPWRLHGVAGQFYFTSILFLTTLGEFPFSNPVLTPFSFQISFLDYANPLPSFLVQRTVYSYPAHSSPIPQ